ncbi:MAG: CMD domain protein [Alphaproteobacteria bacterium]|nr:MAG: CMD domain protein [Alphaproteobacteria bacterium]
MNDVMDTLAGLQPGSPLFDLRRQRPDVVKHLQGSNSAIFSPQDDGGLTRAERAAAALRVATLLRDDALAEHYRIQLAALDLTGTLAGTIEGTARMTEPRWDAILAHVDLVTRGPGSAEHKDIDNLLAAGLSSHAVVSLSQIVAYVNFQSRVLAGLRALKGGA